MWKKKKKKKQREWKKMMKKNNNNNGNNGDSNGNNINSKKNNYNNNDGINNSNIKTSKICNRFSQSKILKWTLAPLWVKKVLEWLHFVILIYEKDINVTDWASAFKFSKFPGYQKYTMLRYHNFNTFALERAACVCCSNFQLFDHQFVLIFSSQSRGHPSL